MRIKKKKNEQMCVCKNVKEEEDCQNGVWLRGQGCILSGYVNDIFEYARQTQAMKTEIPMN